MGLTRTLIKPKYWTGMMVVLTGVLPLALVNILVVLFQRVGGGGEGGWRQGGWKGWLRC